VTAARTEVLLVTGVGDTVGQAVIKAARAVPRRVVVVGTDASPHAAGLAWADVAARLPHSSDEGAYLAALSELCLREAVTLVIPTSEAELRLLSQRGDEVRRRSGAAIVAGPSSAVTTALDKWATCQFLAAHGLAHPQYARADVADEVERLLDTIGLPLFAKPRWGTGSRGAAVVRTRDDLAVVRTSQTPVVLQELLGSADQEFSVATWTCQDGTTRGPISYRRVHISAGDTALAVVASHPDVEVEGLAVARALRSPGPCNVQLRLTDRGPVTFEINPRFSGGTAIRAHFGFNEVDMALREHVLATPVEEPCLRSGVAQRYWQEQYHDDDDPAAP
jgi:carbamoyl-phosphate synthase large subunit